MSTVVEKSYTMTTCVCISLISIIASLTTLTTGTSVLHGTAFLGRRDDYDFSYLYERCGVGAVHHSVTKKAFNDPRPGGIDGAELGAGRGQGLSIFSRCRLEL